MQAKRIETVAREFVQKHFPKVPVFLIDVVGHLVLTAREFAQTFPIAPRQDVAQFVLVLRRRCAAVKQVSSPYGVDARERTA